MIDVYLTPPTGRKVERMATLTNEQRAMIIHDAARECGMDGHIVHAENKKCLHTMAQKAMGELGYYKGMPHKESYLYMDSVDSCFYISANDKACMTFTARWFAGSRDIDGENLPKALELCNKMLNTMQRMIDELKEPTNEI